MINQLEIAELAMPTCKVCKGTGIIRGAKPCGCVLREVCRQCLEHSSACAAGVLGSEGSKNRPADVSYVYRKFFADFYRCTQRELSGLRLDLFECFFILGNNPGLICKRFRISRDKFFSEISLIEEALGAAFCKARPYPLFPLNEYFVARFARYSALSPAAPRRVRAQKAAAAAA